MWRCNKCGAVWTGNPNQGHGIIPDSLEKKAKGDAVLLAANRITHMDYPDDAEERLRRFSEDAELLAATVLAEEAPR